MGQGINKQPDPEEVELQDNLEKKWTDIFNSLDEENKPPDNKINCTILREKIRKNKDIANNLEFRKTYIEGIIIRLDVNNDGHIEKEDLICVIKQSTKQIREWKKVFRNLDSADGSADGKIKIEDLKKWLKTVGLLQHIDLECNSGLGSKTIRKIIRTELKKADKNNDGFIDEQEFLDLVMDKSLDQNMALDKHAFMTYLKGVAYAEHCQWWPPSLFIIVISMIELILFLINQNKYHATIEATKDCNYLLFDPQRRDQIWRFLTYMFVHANFMHVLTNIVGQVIVGVPLEMAHGSLRVAVVYFIGVVTGSLFSSVITESTNGCSSPLVGASGGVYALIAAHLASIILNWKDDMYILRRRFRFWKGKKAKKLSGQGTMIRCLRLAFVAMYASFDILLVYLKMSAPKVSWQAHLGGSLAGLLVGILVLQNRRVSHWETGLKRFCLITFGIFVVVCVAINIFSKCELKCVEERIYLAENDTKLNCTWPF